MTSPLTKVSFDAVDTLFFRDGSPFNRGELQSSHRTLFPPSPKTLAGAIQVACANTLGWDGKGRNGNWRETCQEVIGNNVDPSPLCFDGPYLQKNGVPLFAAPEHLLGQLCDEAPPQDMVLLQPGKARDCDIGEARLMTYTGTSTDTPYKPLAGDWWLSLNGLNQVLAGQPPNSDTLFHKSELWCSEQRVGITRNEKRVTGPQALYAPEHIRLGHDVTLSMLVEHLTLKSGAQTDAILPVGGEGRSCSLSFTKGEHFALLPKPKSENGQYIVVALTPICLPEHQSLKPQAEIIGLPGVLVSACLGKPAMFGGWSADGGPQPLRPCLSPGSVLFMSGGNFLGETIAQPISIGSWTQWGFGRVAIGRWKNEEKR